MNLSEWLLLALFACLGILLIICIIDNFRIHSPKDLYLHQKLLKTKGIEIRQKDGYTKFNYGIIVDWSDPVVQWCRGITFNAQGKIVCCPFFKFGNYGESYVKPLDWNSARVLEKIDGSIISVWYDQDVWHISTNKGIDAFDNKIDGYCKELNTTDFSFGSLAQYAFEKQNLDFESLDKDCTYIFELVSPYNKVVIEYSEIKVYHLGTRNNKTLEEFECDIGIEKPKSYAIRTLEEAKIAVEYLKDKEGFVAVDKYYNRCKIKNSEYLYKHHLVANGILTLRRCLDLISTGEIDEYLAYFPEKRDTVEYVKEKLSVLYTKLDSQVREFKKLDIRKMDRKLAAELIKKTEEPGYFFSWLTHKESSRRWFKNLPAAKQRILLGINRGNIEIESND